MDSCSRFYTWRAILGYRENSPVKEEHAWAHSTAASPEKIHRIPPLASEVSRERTRGEATRCGGKGEPATISYKFFISASPTPRISTWCKHHIVV